MSREEYTKPIENPGTERQVNVAVRRLKEWMNESNRTCDLAKITRVQLADLLTDWVIQLRTKRVLESTTTRRSPRLQAQQTMEPTKELRSSTFRSYVACVTMYINKLWASVNRGDEVPIMITEEEVFAQYYTAIRRRLMEIEDVEGPGRPTPSISKRDEIALITNLDMTKTEHGAFWAMFCISKHCSLRSSELTKLIMKQVEMKEGDLGRFVQIKLSHRKGQSVTLDSRTSEKAVLKIWENDPQDPFDPYKAVERYLGWRLNHNNPRFWLGLNHRRRQDGERFTNRQMGYKRICSLLKEVAESCGVTSRITPHSGRATSVNRMMDSGVDESRAMKRTGHRSLAGYRAYGRTSEQRDRTIDDAIRHRVAISNQLSTEARPQRESSVPTNQAGNLGGRVQVFVNSPGAVVNVYGHLFHYYIAEKRLRMEMLVISSKYTRDAEISTKKYTFWS